MPASTPTVQTILLQALNRHRNRMCLRWEGGGATYSETAARIIPLARRFQELTPAGARVAIALDNGREYIESMLACAAAGRVRAPLNPREPAESLAKKIDLADAELVVTDSRVWEEIRPSLSSAADVLLVDREDGYDRAVTTSASPQSLELVKADSFYRLSFTGGTTGMPKAVAQTHRQEFAMIRNLLLETLRPGEATVFVAATPLSHASGAFVLPTILQGGSLAWTSRFDSARLVDADWLEHGLRIQTFLVPTSLGDLVDVAPEDHALDTVVYGGAPCPPAVLARAVDRIGLVLVQVYGQAEAPMTICVLDKGDHARLDESAGSVGRPFAFVDVAIEDSLGNRLAAGEVGEVVVRAEHIMTGYWNDPVETATRLRSDGALLTQDLGLIDEAGRLRLVGRSREMLISGGFNVFPDDIERRIGSLPGVESFAVFGVPHDRWGEAVVVAAVTAIPEGDVLDLLNGDAGAALAYYERPKRVVVVERLPLTSIGKVSRNELRATFASLFDGRG